MASETDNVNDQIVKMCVYSGIIVIALVVTRYGIAKFKYFKIDGQVKSNVQQEQVEQENEKNKALVNPQLLKLGAVYIVISSVLFLIFRLIYNKYQPIASKKVKVLDLFWFIIPQIVIFGFLIYMKQYYDMNTSDMELFQMFGTICFITSVLTNIPTNKSP
jgi:heme/copper-type cytochrome/quinol oxidase subunit 2